jgi:putative Mn2+ efflux pump MntP
VTASVKSISRREIMSIAELFLLAVGLSMDAFAVSICKGLSLRNIKVKHMLIAGAWFGGFQALMPTVGYVLGSFFADLVSKWSHWIAFVLLLFIGGSMIKESFGGEEEVDADMSFKVMFLLAVATSIDALAVGVSFAFLKLSTLYIILAVLFIGCITFICSAVGVKIGSIFGTKYKSKAELAGGIILILIGVKVVLDGLGIL